MVGLDAITMYKVIPLRPAICKRSLSAHVSCTRNLMRQTAKATDLIDDEERKEFRIGQEPPGPLRVVARSVRVYELSSESTVQQTGACIDVHFVDYCTTYGTTISLPLLILLS